MRKPRNRSAKAGEKRKDKRGLTGVLGKGQPETRPGNIIERVRQMVLDGDLG